MGVVAGIVQRLGDAVAADAANHASGAQSYSQQMVNLLGSYVQTVGQPADSSSLPSVLSAFQQALTTLSSTPDSATAQAQTVAAAQNLTTTFHSVGTAIAGAREQADQGIASDVTLVNQTLDQFAENEARLQQAAARGDSTAPFEDTRANLLANLSQKLPIKVFHSDNNAIIVTTDQGTTLWDTTEHKLSFNASPNIGASQTTGLSAVTVDGAPIQMSQTGSIAANLQLRDGTLTGFAHQLDQMAGNLITAFQQQDPSVAAGQTGVFTEAGAALDATDPSAIPGLAGKIQVNASLDPTQGGQYWRVRDGAQAATQGPAGDNTTVLGFINALQRPQIIRRDHRPAREYDARQCRVADRGRSTGCALHVDRSQHHSDPTDAGCAVRAQQRDGRERGRRAAAVASRAAHLRGQRTGDTGGSENARRTECVELTERRQ